MSVEERAGPGIATVAGREAVRVRRPGTRDELREVVMEPDGGDPGPYRWRDSEGVGERAGWRLRGDRPA